jgi:hypothetical protein
MQKKDVTEILKVFEKRITKLENRVQELEAAHEEAEVKKETTRNNDDLETSFNQLSTRTVSYDSADKVVSEKGKFLGLKQFTTSEDSVVVGYSSLQAVVENEPLVPELEEGEVYEPLLPSSSSSSPRLSHGRSSGKTTPKSLERYNARNARTKGRERQSQGQGQVQEQQKADGEAEEHSRHAPARGRTKSETSVTTVSAIKSGLVEPSESPTVKTEMHYGLMVQYPLEES